MKAEKLVAYGCGNHSLCGTHEYVQQEYAKIAAIRDGMEEKHDFDAIREAVRKNGQPLHTAWPKCMDLVWEEYCRLKKEAA